MRRAHVRVNASGEIVEIMHGSDCSPVRQRKQAGYEWHDVTNDPHLYLVQGLEERREWTVQDGVLVRR
jgi:hypothetical protein